MSQHAWPAEVQARFYVAEVTHTAYGPKGAAKVALVAVSRGDQNVQWAQATPSGRIEMTINNEPAATYFLDHLGEDIAVSFHAVPALQPEDGHPFRLSKMAEGMYGHGMCGDCGGKLDDHVADG